jgi:Fe-S-cluster containining protein
VIAVHELEKGTYEACRHLSASGCGIYADRPRSCRTFECQWLRGVLEVDGTVDVALRPDSCGVIFDYQPESAFGEAYTAWEVEPGASAGGRARDIIEGLAERFLVRVVACHAEDGKEVGDPRFVGPPHLVMLASDVMWSR